VPTLVALLCGQFELLQSVEGVGRGRFLLEEKESKQLIRTDCLDLLHRRGVQALVCTSGALGSQLPAAAGGPTALSWSNRL
jgi:hypothetical protein